MTKIIDYFFFGLLFCFFYSDLSGQQSKIDSLFGLLKNDKNDTNKVNHLNILAEEYRSIGTYDSSIIYANRAVNLSLQLKPNYKKGIAFAYSILGHAYSNQDHYHPALDFYLKALKLDEEAGNKIGMATDYYGIATIYYALDDFPKSIEYDLHALNLFEETGNKIGIAITTGEIGYYYTQLTNYPKAIEYTSRALKISKELGDKKQISYNISRFGKIYSDKGEYTKALEYYKEGLKMGEESNDQYLISGTLWGIGSLYFKIGKFDEAEAALKQSLVIGEKAHATDWVINANEKLSQLYDTTGRPALAFVHYKKFIALRNTISGEELKKKLVQAELNFEYEKKELAAKAEQEKKDAITNVFIYSISSGFLLVLLFALFIFRSFRQKKKANKLLESKNNLIYEQKQILECKQKEVLDSIHYAKRIQESLLPSEKYIARNLNRLKKR